MNETQDRNETANITVGKSEMAKTDEETSAAEERAHMRRIVNVFRRYRHTSLLRLQTELAAFRALSDVHRQLLADRYPKHLELLLERIDRNHCVLQTMIAGVEWMFENQPSDYDDDAVIADESEKAVSNFDVEKLHSTLRQIVRDWSQEGVAERECCYGRILADLSRRWPTVSARSSVRVLVPGAGLGRLAFDIAQLGFVCQGNEFSLYMLFVSNFILNRCSSDMVNSVTIYPFIHQSSNNLSYEDRTRAVQFPDVDTTSLPQDIPNNFSMAAGDFVDVYGGDDSVAAWDCVVTVFFIDTARNILQYFEVIHRILRPGGIWINYGPLLYHFGDDTKNPSIQLPYEEVRGLLDKYGFEVESESLDSETSYTQNSRSMLRYSYRCGFWIARKSDTLVQSDK